MKHTRIGSLLLALGFLLSIAVPAAAQSSEDNLNETIASAKERYSRVYMKDAETASPGTVAQSPIEEHLPAIGAFIIVSNSEEESEQLFDFFIEMSEGDGYTIEQIDDLGDEAALIVEPSPSIAENILLARDGDVITMAVSSVGGADVELLKAMVGFTLEHGPADEEPVIGEDGTATGGWAEAFPEPDEVEGLESYEAFPVMLFELPTPVQVATPSVKPVEISTPAN